MEKIMINCDRAPKAIGPYSQAIKFGNLLYSSGQIPIDPKTNELVEGGVDAQTRQVLDNLKEVLESCGSSLKNVLKATIFLTSMNDYQKVNEIYSLYFEDSKPARSCVEVSRLPKDVSVEIEVVAFAN